MTYKEAVSMFLGKDVFAIKNGVLSRGRVNTIEQIEDGSTYTEIICHVCTGGPYTTFRPNQLRLIDQPKKLEPMPLPG